MFNNQFFQLNRVQSTISLGGKMHKKRNGTIWSRIMMTATAVMVALSMSLGVTSASGDDGVIETPAITATPTPTAEPTDDPVIEAPEEEGTEEPETNASAPPATTTAEPTEDTTQTPTSTSTATVEPTDDPTEDPTEEPVPPMKKFVDVTIGKCKVTITQKKGVDWTEVIADNGDPAHWGISKGKPTLVVKPVDPTKDLVVRIIPVISENEAWEYSVTLKAGSCDNDPDPKPTQTSTTPPSGKPSGEPTDPPSGKPTGEPTKAPTTTPPSGKPTGEPTKAPTTAPSDKDKSDPSGPAKTGAIGDNSNGAILVGAALAAVLTLALVAMRISRRPSGKYAARS